MTPTQAPLSLLSCLLLLSCAASSLQGNSAVQTTKTYYCNRSGQPTRIDNAQPADFLLSTSYADSSGQVSANMRCRFLVDAPANGSLYYLELAQNPPILWGWPGLAVREAGPSLPRSGKVLAASRYDNDYYQVPAEQTVLVTRPGGSLTISFDTSGSVGLGQAPIVLRLRRFVNCPPGWQEVDGYCFTSQDGTVGSGRRLSFATAQTACNAMRSNLLMTSFGGKRIGNDSVQPFCSKALHYRQDAWIGMVAKRGRHHGTFLVGLDGSSFELNKAPDSFRCASSLGAASKNCRDYERCVYVSVAVSAPYAGLVVDKCDWYVSHPFACFMPPNGTDIFYRVPQYGSQLLAWLLPTLAACLVGGMVVFCLLLARRRRRRMRRLMSGPDCARQPILAQPPVGYDVNGQPIPGWHAGQVQHQQPPYPQPYHQQQQGDGGYETFGAGASPAPPAYSPPVPQQQQQQQYQNDKK